MTIDLGAGLGGVVRLGDPQYGEVTERAGLTFGAGLLLAPMRAFAVGLAYEHVDLGRETSGVAESGSFSLTRDLNAIWASLRLYPFAGDVRPFLGLGAGLVWQSADASGTYASAPFAQTPFTCEGAGEADFGFSLAAGLEAPLTERLFLTGDVSFRAYRLTSDPLEGEEQGYTFLCAPGAGSVNAFALRAGVAYRFDVSRYVR